MSVLTEESKLQEIVQLVGSDALPEDQQLTLGSSKNAQRVLPSTECFPRRGYVL